MFKDDGDVIHFKNPHVTASPASNTFTVSGQNDVKKMTDIPGVLNQLGLEGIQNMIRQQESKKKADNGIPSTGNFDEIDLE
jgi:nascent polypeptide-associated complex subunit beta